MVKGTASQMIQHMNKLGFHLPMLLFVWLKFNDAQKTSLSGLPRLKIPGISSYGHFWKYLNTHIIGVPDAQKRYTQKHFAWASAEHF